MDNYWKASWLETQTKFTLVHDDFVNHNAPEGVQDKQGSKEIIKMVHDTFSQFDKLDLKPEVLFAKGE